MAKRFQNKQEGSAMERGYAVDEARGSEKAAAILFSLLLLVCRKNKKNVGIFP